MIPILVLGAEPDEDNDVFSVDCIKHLGFPIKVDFIPTNFEGLRSGMVDVHLKDNTLWADLPEEKVISELELSIGYICTDISLEEGICLIRKINPMCVSYVSRHTQHELLYKE